MDHRGLPRRLPSVPVPVDGESFPSWLSRAAADWQIAPGQAAQVLGLACHPSYSGVRPLWFGTALTQRSLQGIRAATGLDAPVIQAMQLSRYADTVLDFTGPDQPAQQEESLARLRNREWALFTSSRACPKCLASAPVWPLWWRLGMAAVCPEHRVLLVDTCRQCDARLGSGYAGHPRGLTTRRQMLDLDLCNNRRSASRRRKAGLCSRRLATHPTVPVPAELADLQQRLLDVADGGPAQVAGSEVTGAEFFAVVRFTAAVVRLVTTAEEISACSALPGAAVEAFTADLHQRQLASLGGGRSQLQASPPSAAHAAAVLALSAPVLFAEDRAACQGALAAWMDRAVALRRRPGKSDPLRPIPRPAALEPLVRAAIRPASRVAGVLASRSQSQAPFTAHHVCHLADPGDYRELIARHLPGTAEISGRRLAAMALARLAGATSWQRAAAALAMDPLKAARAANTLVQRIGDAGAFWQDIERLGARLVEHGLIDYAARRWALSGLTEVPHLVLFAVCHPLGYDVTEQRRRHAAAWIWQHFTGGDVRDAPAYAPHLWAPTGMTSVREGARRFAAWLPASVACELTAHGQALLDGATEGKRGA
ncbi:TniQ family protein [Streptomyces sp. NBC_01142]|uniref:TniQ family protein n=1 Tax=Streptomyces sp. NBC_01142 TaxID=2975865 RepID=UPI00224E0ADC|nr:TniQ family protein [Streptomyces sp. NBC_01142]MCX4824776.1 TniQ family protein [Streptomyces sp. NBC_01142]MCX4826989.1 TniQ family protein [Streptomyces sp. NBC_01142]